MMGIHLSILSSKHGPSLLIFTGQERHHLAYIFLIPSAIMLSQYWVRAAQKGFMLMSDEGVKLEFRGITRIERVEGGKIEMGAPTNAKSN